MAVAEKESTYLSPEQIKSLSIINGNLVWRTEDGALLTAESYRAFPLSYPDKYIVLRDQKDNELGILEDLGMLGPEICEAINSQLEQRYFLPQVVKINKMTERFGSAIWDMETNRGHVVVSTRQLSEAVRELGHHRFLIIDVDGNRYEVRDVRELPPESQAHFIGR